ncbi:hypothetical protein NX029_11555 [Cytobacillus firmus]|nr:hypothetical protein [Cytobacillus firmus]
MSNRDATDTIKGYFYQFDYAISTILELSNDDDFITLEGIEDIDTKTIKEETAIQCKYYAKTEYNHSIIAKPIRLMLNHFAAVKQGHQKHVKYYLYGHYKMGHDKLSIPISVDFLKEKFLTYTKNGNKNYHHASLSLSDQDLQEFITRLTINIHAVNYDEQHKTIINYIERVFNCSNFEAEHYYYNNALKLIKELSIKDKVEERRISKKVFLKQINNKQALFNEWYLLLKGKEQFLKNLRKEYFTNLNSSPFERFFLIELNKKDYSRYGLKDLMFLISKKWSNLSKRNPKPFCPYVYLHNLSSSELIEIKKELLEEGFRFVDGYSFMGAPFSTNLLCETANYSNQIQIKIINNLNEINLAIDHIKKTREVYQFYHSDPFFDLNIAGVKHVKIQYEQLKDIKEII